eukprot:9003652-Alexandrium_andersonii.AAC.1
MAEQREGAFPAEGRRGRAVGCGPALLFPAGGGSGGMCARCESRPGRGPGMGDLCGRRAEFRFSVRATSGAGRPLGSRGPGVA